MKTIRHLLRLQIRLRSLLRRALSLARYIRALQPRRGSTRLFPAFRQRLDPGRFDATRRHAA